MKLFIPKLCAVAIACCLSNTAFAAANVSANISYEAGEYPNDYSYQGPRTDLTINPAGSNWYLGFAYRTREHDSEQKYSRADMNAGYRFRYDGGWVQPTFNIRQDVTNYTNGTRIEATMYKPSIDYSYVLTDSISLWGDISMGIERINERTAASAIRDSDYFVYEAEPGIRYTINKWSNISLSYYINGKHSDKGDVWGLTDNSQSQQARIYASIVTPFGLTISPYIRQSIGYGSTSAWYDSALYDELETKTKLTRYAVRAMYPLSKTFTLAAEWYTETSKFKEGYTLGKEDQTMDYFRIGGVFTF
ncbi:OmpG family monomeric porin [Photobacterium phosphoreum]|uniref:OmpG family monomeric porin n=1 Tax=Photobacterium phosphoreum TaxID=659 RepID=UPI001E4250FD|nr:OmpG family monomeric porin [Photobacterium phosphoreum]MCD9505478.1 hypothetical protein [Photobacterium phosphoreum]